MAEALALATYCLFALSQISIVPRAGVMSHSNHGRDHLSALVIAIGNVAAPALVESSNGIPKLLAVIFPAPNWQVEEH
jgi:hypothetical protein